MNLRDFKKKYFDINNCPICCKELKIYSEKNKRCENNCFSVVMYVEIFKVKIFDKPLSFYREWIRHGEVEIDRRRNMNKDFKVAINNEIEYWKENDRYLGEILIN